MTSFGRLTVSGITGSNENTVALANVNVDFSLLKILAPKEFMDVGNSLSAFPRKLGAIFEPILPSTPHLLQTYGTRASEIAQKTAASIPKAQGIFTKQSGVDAASIWAAATSGSGALQVHLLACMLARIWEQKDAISIWEEILQSRKLEIQESFQNEGSMSMAACSSYLASLQTITRTHIGEWDDSARSWLRIADRSPTILVRQTQLDQIVGKSRNTVNSRPSLYSSVIEAWKSAMEGTERLLKGSPQKMQTGGLLLGLNAWYLYPDINLLGDPNMFSEFKDPLVPQSGILTIGMVGSATLSEGLHWSLPLAHLRYYGDPIPRIGRLRGVRNRISLPEFMQTILGCLLELWETVDSTTEDVLKWIVMLKETISVAPVSVIDPRLFQLFDRTWLALLARAAQAFLDSKGDDRVLNKRLINAGRLYGSKALLGKPPTPFFGLSQTLHYFYALKHQESKVKFLRELLKNQKRHKDHVIIRYVSTFTGKEEFASLFPHVQTFKRRHDGTTHSQSSYARWVHSKPSKYSRESEVERQDVKRDVFMGITESKRSQSTSKSSPRSFASTLSTENEEKDDDVMYIATLPATTQPAKIKDDWTLANEEFETRRNHFESSGEVVYSIEDEKLDTLEKKNGMRVVWGEQIGMTGEDLDTWHWNPPYGEVKHFSPFFGDFNGVALFLRMGEAEPMIPENVGFRDLESLFRNDNLDGDALPLIFFDGLCSLGADCVRSLRAIATIHQMYASLPSATLAIKLLELDYPLSRAHWLPKDPAKLYTQPPLDEDQSEDVDNNGNKAVPSDSGNGLETSDLLQDAFESIGAHLREPRSDENKHFRRRFDHFMKLRGMASRCLLPYELQLPKTFSCVLLCESGIFNIPSSHMMDIMAISSGDSMYIAAPLLTDPGRAQSKIHKIRHVMGNIGRAGTALLQAPVNPKIRTIGVEQWTYISAEDWDGNRRDAFKDTSLHLWFTGSSVAVDGKHAAFGEKDTELYILESVVSVHGRGLEGPGEWVADLDILKALRDSSLNIDNPSRLPPSTTNEIIHDTVCARHENSTYNAEALKLTAIENWIELLETPVGNSIILAMGNWQARQAATAISVARGRNTCVLQDITCWACMAEQYKRLSQSNKTVTFIA